jgi:hypothetical protein
MLNCQKCNFKILPKMRFALVKNFCPSCGGTLLSDLDSHEIGVINKKLQSQEFIVNLSEQLNKDLVQNLIYDLSIFIKFDLKKEMSLAPQDSALENPELEETEEDGSEDQEEDERPKMPSKKISRVAGVANRQESPTPARSLRRMSSYDNEPEDEYGDEDEPSEESDEGLDDRVKRLKKLYNTSPTLKKFQGITRSDDI